MTRRAQSVLCIGCPTGCSGEVVIEDGVVVEMHGYTCKRGRAYVTEEVIAPKRMVTTTVRINGGALALLPVVSDQPVPKDLIFACIGQLRKVTVTAPVAADSIVLADVLGLGVNFVAARDCPSFGTPAWIEADQGAGEESEAADGFRFFEKQLDLLHKRLLADPNSLRRVFIDNGTRAIVWEFRQDRLGAEFTKTLWKLLLNNDEMSLVLQRFIQALPLESKRKFIAALDGHLSGRYPMFKGLSKDWPAENRIGPDERPAGEREEDSGAVAPDYLDYRALGYSTREVDLFAWLEELRDKQSGDGPPEVGAASPRQEDAEGRLPGQDASGSTSPTRRNPCPTPIT